MEVAKAILTIRKSSKKGIEILIFVRKVIEIITYSLTDCTSNRERLKGIYVRQLFIKVRIFTKRLRKVMNFTSIN